ncbi:DUF732 domain-containing protein [Mycobacterium sp.]|uniref:DUF732 domain-containing protein n=1 Tax=Mycobacterium sp. TaxID=1785 RepID=UPI0025FCA841|nr:DUF732 domain-containing protein [Mycobacterium sp.]MBW0012324.1 DUF732 domain-containing protein [Mycobacterium sp.]
MTNTRTRLGRLSALVTGGAAAAALLGLLQSAPAARADNTDSAFISALHAHNITHESDRAAITAGHLVCHQLDMGKSQEQIATDVMNSSGMDGDSAGYFVAVAERAYCPQYDDEPR